MKSKSYDYSSYGVQDTIGSAEDYRRSLAGRKLRVFLFGQQLEDPINHPMIRPSVNAMAETYALAERDPQLASVESEISQRRVNRFLHIARSPEDLVNQGRMQRRLGQLTGTCFQRCVGMDAINALHSTTFDMDARNGTDYHARFLAFVEQDLERADSHREHPDAPVVHLARLCLQIGRVEDVELGHHDRRNADRQVDVEDPAPAVRIGEPAAHDRPEDGRHDDAEPPEAHRLASILRRKGFQQDRLRQRLQRAAGRALDDPEDHERGQVRRSAAQQGQQREAGRRHHEQPLAPERGGQIQRLLGEGQHAVGCDITAHHLRPVGAGTVYCTARLRRSQGGYDNNHPREWTAKLSGWQARAAAAQNNGFEALPLFIFAVLAAQMAQVDQARIDHLALAFVGVRVLYVVIYLANLAALRSLVWFAGLAITIAIFAPTLGL